GLDFEEAAGDLGVVAVLWWGRGSFHVEHEPLSRRAGLVRAPLVAAGGLLVSFTVVAAAAHHAALGTLARDTGDLLLWQPGPVGPEDALPALLVQLAAFAEQRGLRLAAIGVGAGSRPLFEQLGLRSLYLGDEAIVDTGSFSLEGRAIRKVRQSVSRLEKAGYR